jgi:hypothetical protein
MDYLFGILTGVVMASWVWWEAMKRQAQAFYTFQHDQIEEEKQKAEQAIKELIGEV